MKTFYLLTMGIFSTLPFFSSCSNFSIKGDGDLLEKEIPIGNYSKLTIESENIDLEYINNDDSAQLSIETDQNIWENLDIKQEGNELKIRPKNKTYRLAPSLLKIRTNSETLKELSMGGSGNSVIQGEISGSELELNMGGAFTLTAPRIFVNELDCNTAGNCTLNLGGKVTETDIKDAGKSVYHAFDLTTEILDCKTAGNSGIEITINQKLDAKMVGTGFIHYKGDPQIINNNSVGDISIKKCKD